MLRKELPSNFTGCKIRQRIVFRGMECMFFPLAMGVLIGAFMIFFLFLAVLAFAPDIAQMINPSVVDILKNVGGPVAAGFGGAIAGAICSYVFQKKNEKERETKADISTIHKTSVHLLMQLNELYSIKKHNIFPSLEHKARFLDISKIPSNPSVTDRVDPRIIDIALSVKEVGVIDTIYLAEARYRACFENFTNRNSSLDEYRASVKAAGVCREGGHSLHDLYEIVGEGQLIALYVMTEQMIEVLDEALQTFSEALELVNQIVDKKYKGFGVLNLKMDLKSDEVYLTKTAPPFFDIEGLRAYLRKVDNR